MHQVERVRRIAEHAEEAPGRARPPGHGRQHDGCHQRRARQTPEQRTPFAPRERRIPHRRIARARRDPKRPCGSGGQAHAFAVEQRDDHAVTEFQNDGVRPEREGQRQRRHAADRHEHQENDGDGGDREAARQHDRQREHRVEKHFVVQRPAEQMHREREAVDARIRPEQERRREARRRVDVPQPRAVHRVDVGDDRNGHRPVERRDAREPAQEKLVRRVGAAEQGFGRIDHHESRDDKEEIDPRGAEQEILERSRLAAEERDLLGRGMQRQHADRRDRAQNLDRFQRRRSACRGSGRFRQASPRPDTAPCGRARAPAPC